VIKDNSSDLEDIGISIKSSGKLEVDKTKLVSCSPAKVGKVLSGDNTITKSVMDYAARIQRSAKGPCQLKEHIHGEEFFYFFHSK